MKKLFLAVFALLFVIGCNNSPTAVEENYP